MIIDPNDRILITGAGGFIGRRVVENLLNRGYGRLRLFVRPSSSVPHLWSLLDEGNSSRLELFTGNLLSRDDCLRATRDVAVIYHLAAGRGEKSVPDAFMNSVVTTRNLLDAAAHHGRLKRVVSVSSFSVYSNMEKAGGRLLEESCAIEARPELRGDAYCFAKAKQDEVVSEYARTRGLPSVTVRPGWVYGPGNEALTGRVGIGTFGLFLHLGGGNQIPATYVDNCADAIVLAGLVSGVDGEVFNVVDDDLPTSRQLLQGYKKHVRSFRSIYLPHFVSYVLCALWEKYSKWSYGQLPPVFNRRAWHAYWKSTRYSNAKVKEKLGWRPHVSTDTGLRRYFESCGTTKVRAG